MEMTPFSERLMLYLEQVLTARQAGQGKWRRDTKLDLKSDSKKLLRAKGSMLTLQEAEGRLS